MITAVTFTAVSAFVLPILAFASLTSTLTLLFVFISARGSARGNGGQLLRVYAPFELLAEFLQSLFEHLLGHWPLIGFFLGLDQRNGHPVRLSLAVEHHFPDLFGKDWCFFEEEPGQVDLQRFRAHISAFEHLNHVRIHHFVLVPDQLLGSLGDPAQDRLHFDLFDIALLFEAGRVQVAVLLRTLLNPACV